MKSLKWVFKNPDQEYSQNYPYSYVEFSKLWASGPFCLELKIEKNSKQTTKQTNKKGTNIKDERHASQICDKHWPEG